METNLLYTLIVEDDAKHLEHLMNLCQRHPEIRITGTCSTGSTAIETLNKKQPDLLLIDIDLGDMTAFDVLDRIPHHNFHIIFTTAYNEYAIQAFRVHAADYLLKPINSAEFDDAITHIRHDNNLKLNHQALIADFRKLTTKFLTIHEKKRIRYIPVSNVLYLEADGSYTIIHFKDDNERQKTTSTGSLSLFETDLLQHGFIRIHQSFLINPNQIREFDKSSGKLTLACGDNVSVARARRHLFER